MCNSCPLTLCNSYYSVRKLKNKSLSTLSRPAVELCGSNTRRMRNRHEEWKEWRRYEEDIRREITRVVSFSLSSIIREMAEELWDKIRTETQTTESIRKTFIKVYGKYVYMFFLYYTASNSQHMQCVCVCVCVVNGSAVLLSILL